MRFISLQNRQTIKAQLRAIDDWFSGFRHKVNYETIGDEWHLLCQVKQEIHDTPFVEEKIHNLAMAFNKLNGIVLCDKNSMSLWALIGAPLEKYGWKNGRTRIRDIMTTSPGGGLCQLSTLIYHMALLSGTEIIERHAHSADGYDDNERYTPLGIDATISYGYKDLRIKNNIGTDIKFTFAINKDHILGQIHSKSQTAPCTLTTTQTNTPTQKIATTTRTFPNGSAELVSKDIYRRE